MPGASPGSDWATQAAEKKVLLAGHHPMVRQSLREIIEGEADLVVVAEAHDMQEALLATRTERPEAVVLDVALAGAKGVADLCRQASKGAAPRIIMVGMTCDCEHVVHALRAGACGYLRTQDAAEELVTALRMACPERPFLGATINREEVMAKVVASRKTAKLLVVEDDPDFVEIVKTALESAGYGVVVAGSKEEGLAKLRSERPDAVILDVMMPEGTEGFHFVWELRQDEDKDLRETPILMLTSIHSSTNLRFYPEQSDSTYGPYEYLPVQDFLDKPVQPKQLLEKVESLLAGRQGRAG